jgi:galactokinase/mevalonate kinase-like predicted kinase
MRVTSKAPCRVDLGRVDLGRVDLGRVDLADATLDIWPLYLFNEDAVTVNFAVDRYTSCVVSTRENGMRAALERKDWAEAGSTGAKVCGAGGGGCVVFLVEPDAKAKVAPHGVKVR